MSTDLIPLSADGKRRLNDLELFIRRGVEAFYETGSALREIRDGKYYKHVEHDTFESYCRDRWGMTRVHAYRLIAAADLRENLLPIGDTFPANEAQARPLVRLLPADQQSAWQAIQERAPQKDGKPILTAKFVAEVAREYDKTVDDTEPEGWTLQEALEHLHEAVEAIAGRWPQEHRAILPMKLCSLATHAGKLAQPDEDDREVGPPAQSARDGEGGAAFHLRLILGALSVLADVKVTEEMKAALAIADVANATLIAVQANDVAVTLSEISIRGARRAGQLIDEEKQRKKAERDERAARRSVKRAEQEAQAVPA